MLTISYGLILMSALAISWCGSHWLASHSKLFRIMDQPNERSLHDIPTPRAGGIAVLLSIFIGWAWMSYVQGLPDIIGNAAISLICVAGISLLDDIRGISPRLRLLVHGVSAAWLILMLPEGWLVVLASWVAVIWMINLYNFMDGIDGLAGGMALVGFGALGLIAWLNGYQLFATYAWIVATSSLGFLFVNLPPARIFMGDVGSVSLGLLVSVFWVWGVRDGVFAFWLPALIFSPFIVDATVTLLRRLVRREHIFEAHCSHYYQRLVQLGWGHRKTVIFEFCLMLICAVAAILLSIANEMLVSIGGIGVLILLYAVIGYRIFCLERIAAEG